MPLVGKKEKDVRDQQVPPKIKKVTPDDNFAVAATGEGGITKDIVFIYS